MNNIVKSAVNSLGSIFHQEPDLSRIIVSAKKIYNDGSVTKHTEMFCKNGSRMVWDSVKDSAKRLHK